MSRLLILLTFHAVILLSVAIPVLQAADHKVDHKKETSAEEVSTELEEEQTQTASHSPPVIAPPEKTETEIGLEGVLARRQLLFRYYGDTARDEYYEHLAELEPGRESQLKTLIFEGRDKIENGDVEAGTVDLIKALKVIEFKLQREPREKRLYSMRSIAYEALQKYDEAYKDLQMVIKLTPKNVDPMVKLSNFVRLQKLENKRKFEQR